MYGWIFSILPGPTWFKIIESLILIAAVILLLMEVVFPWISEFNVFTDSTIGDQ